MKLSKLIKFILIVVIISAVILIGVSQILHINLLNEIKTTINTLIKPVSSPQEIEDSTPLVVEISSGKHETLQPRISLTVIANKMIEASDTEKFKLTYVTDKQGQKYYALEIVNIGLGQASIPVEFKDNSGHTSTTTVNVTRLDYSLPFGLSDIRDWDGSKYTVDGDNLLVKVNKQNKLVSDYAPTDLVDLNKDKLLYTNVAGILLRSEAAEALSIMLKNLKEQTGKTIVIASGYRSYNNQYKQYASWVRELGQVEADKVSARPGFSEHQLGTAVDFMSQDSGFDFVNAFDTTIAGKWLKENAYKYGYVQSYPQGKESQTGYSYEAWHYRYIGLDSAKALKDSGLTLKEYLEKLTK